MKLASDSFSMGIVRPSAAPTICQFVKTMRTISAKAMLAIAK